MFKFNEQDLYEVPNMSSMIFNSNIDEWSLGESYGNNWEQELVHGNDCYKCF